MGKKILKTKLLALTVTISSYGALAQSFDGSGQGGVLDGVIVGGGGGGSVHWGGQGGGVKAAPPQNPTTQGDGSKGTVPPGTSPNSGTDGGKLGITINNSTDIMPVGQRGGDGVASNVGVYTGGGGGAGAVINANTYTLTTTVSGGNGADTGWLFPIRTAGPGAGGGGVGVIFNGQTLNISADGQINGGNGGGTGSLATAADITAGGGGGAALILNSGTVNNDGIILGGRGGPNLFARDTSGSGGAGVYMAANTVLNNTNAIGGGTSPMSFAPLQPAIIMDGDNILVTNIGPSANIALNAGIAGRPAILSQGNNNKIINSGTILGNQGGDQLFTSAIEFHGNDNTLELRGGWKIDRLVIADGTNNHLILGGADASSMDLSLIGSSSSGIQFRGFTDYTKNGTSTWTATGVLSDTGPWAIEGGTLALTNDADMAAAGKVTVDATLDISGITAASTGMKNVSGSSTGRIVLGDRTLALQADSPQTFAGIISGAGGGIEIVDGTQVFTANNTYTGTTTIDSGAALHLGSNTSTGSIVGDAKVDGDLVFDRTVELTYDGDITGAGTIHQTNQGKLILTGDGGAFSGETSIASATALDIGNGGISGNLGGTIAVDGALSFNRSDEWNMNAILQGGGVINQNGSGKTRLTADSSGFSGQTTINAGTLIVNNTLGGNINLLAGTLQGSGTVGPVVSTAQGTISPGDNDFGTLAINGDFTMDGGTVEIAAALAGDDSPTSRLSVSGNTSGTGTVHVFNRNGMGAKTINGIEIIRVGGQSDADFTLQPDFTTKDGRAAVVAGAYAYTLHKGQPAQDDGNWYLRSELTSPPPPGPPTPPTPSMPLYNPGTPIYESGVQTMQQLNRLPTLQKRVGNRYWAGVANPYIIQGDGPGLTDEAPSPEARSNIDSNSVWARIEGGYTRLNPKVSTTNSRQNLNTVILQAGIDGLFYDGENGMLIGGITGQYTKATSNVYSPHGDGKTDTNAWGLGGTMTWYGENGFYVDGQGQVNWFTNDYTSSYKVDDLASGRHAVGYALSIETGQRIAVNSNWSVTPQAQLIWSSISMNSFKDLWDASVSLQKGDSLTGRIGASLDYWSAWRSSEGQLVRTNVYTFANIYQDFISDNSIRVADTIFTTTQDRTWGELGFGGTYTWADDKYAIYGEGAVNTSLANFAKSYDVRGIIGIRVKW
ncbi:autotransporter outer membrane beta-barrel domain-containing protein [Brucella sp. 10RB9210]|uniref:autotransporter outer membrane beta-barrel domain-containing protein n=1 Tax=Brucella sp. 10RB9210 TaxID=1844037 RepID=UPI0012AD8205|nr:autotransporter outer membrane beta-barrel domain-containing protein [Brucella sp. 10RB9210]MRN77240.1 autotransporter outer membrane beta-barrel domain-containing protein [Brucella sp. 10RB9210]